jgi:hypothetical protein
VLKIAFGNFKLAICGVWAVLAFLSNIGIIVTVSDESDKGENLS